MTKLVLHFLLTLPLKHVLAITFNVQYKPCSCSHNFQGRVEMRHLLGNISMYLHMMKSMVSSVPQPSDVNLKSL